MRFSISCIVIFFVPFYAISQVGIGTTTPNAQLEIKSTNQATPSNTDGILIPKVDEFPATAPTASQDGMMVYVTGTGTPSKGYYYWDNATTSWVVFSSSVEKINDLSDGKSDNDGTQNGSSIFLGINAGLNDDGTDNNNVGIGYEALKTNRTGTRNTATGYQSLYFNTPNGANTGANNTANGYRSLYSNTTGVNNVATGSRSLYSNTTGWQNIATGSWSLYFNTTGYNNTATGDNSLNRNMTGYQNTATGQRSLYANLTGVGNTANGFWSLYSNIEGSLNTASGQESGFSSIGGRNIFLGYKSGYFETGSDKLYIESSNADANNALIYGEFNNNILRVNGELQLGNTAATRYAMPTADGTTNQVLQTDGAGSLSWINGSTLGAEKINDLSDGKSDNDGSEDGSSIFLGINAGLNDDGTDNKNVGIGYEALQANTTGTYNTANGNRSLYTNISGYWNTAIGNRSLNSNTTGSYNTANGASSLGANTTGDSNIAYGLNSLYSNTTGDRNVGMGNGSGWSNSTGSRNIFLGAESGYFETGSDKLYIESSDADANNALIYGEFGTDATTTGNILRVNGQLQLGNAAATRYAMPTVDGTTNQVLQTDGSGNLSWINPSALADGDWTTVGANIERQSGDVYIGNTAATNNDLYISGDIFDWDDTTYLINPNWVNRLNEISLDNGSASDPKIHFTETNSGFYSPGADITSYTANGSEAVRFEVNGMVKILSVIDASGTSGSGVLEIGGSLRLDDNEIITNTNLTLHIQANNNGDLRVDDTTLVVDASTNRIGIGTTSPSYQLHLTTNSAAKPTSSAWTVTSDERLKKNVKPFTDGLDLIKKIDPIWFTYNGKAGMPNDTGVGTLAQEFQKIAPYMVKPWQYTDEEKGVSETYLGIDYGPLNFVVVNAIKEQQIEIESQRKEIEELKKLVQQLIDKK